MDDVDLPISDRRADGNSRRQREPDGAWICLSATDPLNLVGTVLPGDKVARLSGARVLYRDGLPVATLVAGQVELLGQLDADEERTARRLLLREPESAMWTELAAAEVPASPQVH